MDEKIILKLTKKEQCDFIKYLQEIIEIGEMYFEKKELNLLKKILVEFLNQTQ